MVGLASGPESDRAILDLRLGAKPKLVVIGDCGWLIRLSRLLRLDRRDRSAWPLTRASGARISFDPLDTKRVCRRGDGLLKDDFRDTGRTSSFNGDGGRCAGLVVV